MFNGLLDTLEQTFMESKRLDLLKLTIDRIDLVYYPLCNIDTLVRAEDTLIDLYNCEKCIFREAVDERNTVCPYKVVVEDNIIKEIK